MIRIVTVTVIVTVLDDYLLPLFMYCICVGNLVKSIHHLTYISSLTATFKLIYD